MDVDILSNELIKRSQNDPNFSNDLKVKSFFDILAVQVKCEKLDFHDAIIKPFLENQLLDLMPEEVVILCRLLGQYGKQNPDFVKEISTSLQFDYLINYIETDQIDFKEVCKIY